MQTLRSKSRLGGSLAVIFSAMLFGSMPLFAKVVYANGGTSISVVFYRVFLPVFLAFFYLLWKDVPLRITRQELFKIVLLTVFGYGGTALLLFTSYLFIPSGMATTLHFSYPVFVILGSMLFLKEKVNLRKGLCVALCMGGILLFYNGKASVSVPGILIAFFSGVTYAFYILYLSRSGLGGMHPIKLIFYLNLCCSLMMATIGLATGQLTTSLTPVGWASMAVLAVVISFSAVILFQAGVRNAGPQNSAILSTFEPITSLILGVLLMDEPVTFRSILGCVLILSAVILVACSKEEDHSPS